MSTEREGRPESPSRIVTMKSWHERCLQPCLFLCSIRQPFLRPDRALLPSPPRADAVKVGRRANHATMSDFARPHLGRWRARRQACMGRAEDDQTIGHREVGARNALSAKPTMCTRMHRSQFPFRTSLQCAGMGTGTPIKRRDCCAIKLRERAYTSISAVMARRVIDGDVAPCLLCLVLA